MEIYKIKQPLHYSDQNATRIYNYGNQNKKCRWHGLKNENKGKHIKR